MNKLLPIIITIAIFLSFSESSIYAADLYVSPSAQVKNEEIPEYYQSDYRVNKLRIFFDKYNSPLSDYSYEFVYWADVYQIDWRLVPAISGVESTFGKRIPLNSYNAYGWSNGDYNFNSWEDSIEHVTKTLRIKYKDKGAVTLDEIAHRYCPPSSTWLYKVKYFMDKIDSTSLSFDL
jgi:hypothetical protein